MNGDQNNEYGIPRKTKLNATDVITHHLHLQGINLKRWRFITCPGGMVNDLCKACKYKGICDKHEEIEQELIKRFVTSFSEGT